MEFPSQLKKTIADYCAAPDDQQMYYRTESAYWSFIADTLAENIRNGKDLHAVIVDLKDFLDFGLCKDILENYNDVKKSITAHSSPFNFLTINTLSSFIEDTIHAITQGNRRDLIEKDIKMTEIQISRLENEISGLQKNRKQLLLTNFGKSAHLNMVVKSTDMMDQIDTWQRLSLETKKEINQGLFVSVEKKREHAKREKNILEELEKIDKFLAGETEQKEAAAQIKQHSKEIFDAFQKVIDMKDAIVKMRADIERIEREQNAISAVEVENKIRTEIDYLKDLVRLSAKRQHISSCPLLKNGETSFSLDQLCLCLDRILEFDPQVFKNDRVAIFGKPTILLIPGMGNALYDWKHNQIVVPMVPYQKNFMASIASGIIEYRLDVDEDKKMLNAYNQLPDYKLIKSIYQLKTKFIKDYIVWMTSEYTGFRVLSTPVKKWFDREIAPKRDEIYTPPEYQPFEMPAADVKKLFDKIEPEIKNAQTATPENLWTGSIITYQRGKFEHAIALLKELLHKKPEMDFAYYNLGQACMKSMHKQEAIDAFNKFSKQHPQSWWNSIAHELVRQLQNG